MKLAFFLTVYREFRAAENQIRQLRALYPDTQSVPILVTTDGTYNQHFENFCRANQIFYQTGERLKTQQAGGKWTERMLKLLLENTAEEIDTYFKIDPADTLVLRPFAYLPADTVDLFGSIREASGRWHVQGGCIGIRRKAAQAIVASGLLGSEKFCSPHYSYPRFDQTALHLYHKEGEAHSSEWLTVEDVILYDVSQDLKLSIEEFPEVWCDYKEIPSTEVRATYAVIHPCYEA